MFGYFSSFGKWALPLLQQQQQQHNTNVRKPTFIVIDEMIMRIYTFISFTVMHCSELIYIRSKPSCFFNIAISNFILPSSLMMGHIQQPRAIILAMHKIYPLLIEGISKLDYRNDPHIGKVLNDVIIKWAPLLKITTNSKVVAKPFIICVNLKNTEVVSLVFSKLAKAFIALQNRKASPHASLILTVFEEVMNVVEDDDNLGRFNNSCD
ncbi:CLUMA_CG012613, isoform B [Clunio marinus]|uniref:CLUMA_CG012613, isoform B n=1 Tax=Clunio marinus TaxID=568069 RepID=A0A1J1IIS5_9DIPT|nr:CLUMA_CG012613, isoform B [Clunio marinus]